MTRSVPGSPSRAERPSHPPTPSPPRRAHVPGTRSFPEKPERSLIPVGMTTISPHTARRVRHLEEVLLATLSRWGYGEIIPPAFEYLDVLQAGLEPDLIEKCYKFSDPTSGRILLLRPDVTAQIARIIAMGIVGSHVPLRLCYRTTVFRYEPEHAGREREIFQVGAELVGSDTVAADGEIIGLMAECLQHLGVQDFKISVGHVGFIKALLAKSGLSPDGQKRAEHAAARKDLPRLEEILRTERISKAQAHRILETPGLYGGEEVLVRGRTLAGRHRDLRVALDRLSAVYHLLIASGLRRHLLLDLGEFRGFEYYDGLVFEVFAEGLGYEVAGGGRYNHLIGRFGRDLPSTGFAFDVDRLFRTMENVPGPPVGSPVQFLICGDAVQQPRVFEAARMLRRTGYRVVQGEVAGTGPIAARAALAEGKRLKAEVVALVAAGLAEDEVIVISGAGKPRRTVMNVKEVPRLLHP